MSAILSTVRRAVRSVIEETPELRQRPDLERQIAQKMVGVSLAAAQLLAEEKRLSDQIAARAQKRRSFASGLALATSPVSSPTRRERAREGPAPLAEAQTAAEHHGMSAVNNAANVLRATRDAIDFPNFVTSLITGVFQSIQTSSIQQLQAFSDLLGAVNASTSDFATTQITAARAATWAASHFNAFTVETDHDDTRLVLRSGAEMPAAAELARVLEATSSEVRTVDESDLTETLLPLVRRKLARDRQAMLSTMVLMGLQRVVVDDGLIHASMDLRVDARSTSEQTTAEQTDTRVETEASGSFGMGAWGASARIAASVGYVHSDEQHTREDIAVSAGLRSSVDVRFHTEPLDTTRVASNRTLDQIRARSLVPETEQGIHQNLLATAPARETRQASFPTPAAPGSLVAPGSTTAAARSAREQHSGANVDGGGTTTTPTTGTTTTAPADTTTTAPADTTTTAPADTTTTAPAETTTAPAPTETATAPTDAATIGAVTARPSAGFSPTTSTSTSIGGRNRVPTLETSGRPRATFRAER